MSRNPTDFYPDDTSEVEVATEVSADDSARKREKEADIEALIDNPQEENAADYKERMAQWSTGIFDCHLDCLGCIRTCLCHPIVAAEVKHSFDETHFMLNIICAFCFPITNSVYMRNELRLGYGIRGNALIDLFLGSVCYPCSICQMHREVAARGGGVTCGGPVQTVMHE